MNQSFARKITAVLSCCCLLLTAFSGAAITTQATELGTAGVPEPLSKSVCESDYWAVVRFRNYYDTATFGSAKTHIDSAIAFTNTIYVANFNVNANRQGDVLVDNISDLSSCIMSNTGPCRQASGCGANHAHHKDVGRIENAFHNRYLQNYYPDDTAEDRRIMVLWSNYPEMYCYNELLNDAYTHWYPGWNAVVMEHRTVIHIMDLGTSLSSRYKAHMSFLLAHEIAHCFGYGDVYISDNHEGDGAFTCLMDFCEYVDLSTTQANAIYLNWLENPTQALCDTCKGGIPSFI